MAILVCLAALATSAFGATSGDFIFSNDGTIIGYAGPGGSVVIPGGNIGAHAFQNCTSITSVTISAGVIGDYAFDGCSNLATVYFTGGPPGFISPFAFGSSHPVYYYHPSLWPDSRSVILGLQGIPYPLQLRWNAPAAITYGTPLSSAQLNATNSENVTGIYLYSDVTGTVLGVGTHTLSVTFQAFPGTIYSQLPDATASVSLVVNRATPMVTWATPTAISSRTALSSAQLNATSSVPGTFSYSPAPGTTLAPGTQNLSVTFTPTDSANYNSATTSVSEVVTEARLSALSVRGYSGSGDNTLMAGVVISGNAPKSLVARGVGPSLEQYGIKGFLADPQLRLFGSSGSQLQMNDDWGGGTSLTNAFAALGLAPLPPASKDAALLVTLNPGNYTSHLTAASGTGIGLMELYDAGPPGDSSRIAALAVRGPVGAGENVLVVGFVISGTGTDRIAIRGIGPALSALGVAGALADPQLKLFNNSGAQIDSNDDWGGGTTLANAFISVGLSTLPAGSKDAALVTTLPPGVYTVQLSGAASTTGIGMIEFYELP